MTFLLLISCKKKPYHYVINEIKNLKIMENEPSYPFSKNYKLLSSQDKSEYHLLINCFGTEITGNIYNPQNNIFYEFQGLIDQVGNFMALIYNTQNQVTDTLKGYFQHDDLKCAFTSNYENVLLGSIDKENFIPMKVYSLKLSGKSEKYPFNPKPQLIVHHTFLTTKDTTQKHFYSILSENFFHKVICCSDSIYELMSNNILKYKDDFEKNMEKQKIYLPVDSLNQTWIKSLEIVYNKDSLISLLYQNVITHGKQKQNQFKTFVYDFKQKKLLSFDELNIKKVPQNIKNFLIYPNFVKIWNEDGSTEKIPISQINLRSQQ